MLKGFSMVTYAYTIAGSEATGGAGFQVDLKTFHELGCQARYADLYRLLSTRPTTGITSPSPSSSASSRTR